MKDLKEIICTGNNCFPKGTILFVSEETEAYYQAYLDIECKTSLGLLNKDARFYRCMSKDEIKRRQKNNA